MQLATLPPTSPSPPPPKPTVAAAAAAAAGAGAAAAATPTQTPGRQLAHLSSAVTPKAVAPKIIDIDDAEEEDEEQNVDMTAGLTRKSHNHNQSGQS